ncbi:MAG: helix-turn-helix transcriptional regulator [Firmicutes bacterium]|nr:helix-turn-helix transcriptional regulator [Bacillota bacterium]
MANFHNRLKKLRKQKSFTQADVGKYLDYGYTTISNYERGKNEPSFSDLIKLADLFGVSTDFLLGHDVVNDDAVYRERVDTQLETVKKNLLSAVGDINSILEPKDSN